MNMQIQIKIDIQERNIYIHKKKNSMTQISTNVLKNNTRFTNKLKHKPDQASCKLTCNFLSWPSSVCHMSHTLYCATKHRWMKIKIA